MTIYSLFIHSVNKIGLLGVIVDIECLYIIICLLSQSNITVKLSKPFTIPF